MNGKDIELTRRRVLGGVATIGAASAAAGAGTFAYFSDTEQSTNTVSAGTLDLQVDSTDSAVTTVDINIGDNNAIKPGETGSGTTTLNNTGNIDGSVDLIFGPASNSGGTTTDPEPTPDDGELGAVLQVEVAVGGNTVRGDFGGSPPPTFNDVFDNSEKDSNIALAGGNSKDLKISWKLPDVGDEVQGDSVSGDITIELNQRDSQ